MPSWPFEVACAGVVVLTLALMARARPIAALAVEYAALAAAAWIGEEGCVALYGFYGYAAGWHGRIDRVPLLVPLIWPLVILSARDVVSSLWPALAGGRRAFAVGAVVAFDA